MTETPDDPMRACEEILSTVRHELGGPMAVLDMMIETLIEHLDELPDEVRDIVGAGRRQLDVARATLEDLHVAGLEQLDLELETVDLGEVTRAYVTDLDTTALRGRDVQVHAPAHPVPVRLDPRRFAQILRNLLDNADKYTPSGTPVNVHVVRQEERAEVWVVDSGDGVAPEHVERIFERYTRGQSDPAGIGIGLAISRQIARAHGGDLNLADAPEGDGARFVLELPLA